MSNQVMTKTTQKEFQRLKYQPGKDYCACGVCSIFTNVRDCDEPNGIKDFKLVGDPDSSCCGGLCQTQPVCSRADPLTCSIGLGINGENPLIKYGWDKTAPNLSCSFDLDKINTRDQIVSFNNKFGMNNDVEAHYCTQKVTTCRPGIKECSRIFSVGEGSTECAKWFGQLSSDLKDVTMNSYCRQHNTQECKCVNRFDEKTYKAMKGYKSFNDGCWYAPCVDEEKNFIPEHLRNPTCPDKICQQLYEFINDQNITIDNVKDDISCDFTSQQTLLPNTNSFVLNKWVVPVVVLMVVGVVIFFMIRKR